MREGDLVKHYIEQDSYGIITSVALYQDQIAGIVAKRHLYTVLWTRGDRQIGLRFWELEVINGNR
jgi:hypothetical protein